MSNKEKNEKTKENFSNFWKKTAEISKKAAEGAKGLAEQTKQNIYDAQAKKYISVFEEDFRSEGFKIPNIIEIVDYSSNRKFITDDKAIGWIERHEDVDALHMYDTFVKDCGLMFIPLAQRSNVYYKDNFEPNRFINANQAFGRATEEKLAELSNIAYCLGAKCCSVEIVELETDTNTKKLNMSSEISATSTNINSNRQSGKRISTFEGSDEPKAPSLKWFAHDDNIKGLIEMRLNKAIKATVLELKGSSSATMSKQVACALDKILGTKGSLSMEASVSKEFSKILVYEIEF